MYICNIVSLYMQYICNKISETIFESFASEQQLCIKRASFWKHRVQFSRGCKNQVNIYSTATDKKIGLNTQMFKGSLFIANQKINPVKY